MMKIFGWALSIFGALACVVAIMFAMNPPVFQAGFRAIAIAITAVGVLFAGVWLIKGE
jgi:hypothetical protein